MALGIGPDGRTVPGSGELRALGIRITKVGLPKIGTLEDGSLEDGAVKHCALRSCTFQRCALNRPLHLQSTDVQDCTSEGVPQIIATAMYRSSGRRAPTSRPRLTGNEPGGQRGCQSVAARHSSSSGDLPNRASKSLKPRSPSELDCSSRVQKSVTDNRRSVGRWSQPAVAPSV